MSKMFPDETTESPKPKALKLPVGWKPFLPWEVRLSGVDGSFSKRPAASYDDAVRQRRESMKSGKFYQCWIEEVRR